METHTFHMMLSSIDNLYTVYYIYSSRCSEGFYLLVGVVTISASCTMYVKKHLNLKDKQKKLSCTDFTKTNKDYSLYMQYASIIIEKFVNTAVHQLYVSISLYLKTTKLGNSQSFNLNLNTVLSIFLYFFIFRLFCRKQVLHVQCRQYGLHMHTCHHNTIISVFLYLLSSD